MLFTMKSGNNANDAFVPLFIVNNNGATFVQTFHLAHLVGGLLGHLSVKVFARFIVEIDVGGLFESYLIILFHQKLHGFFGILHAARSVDAWPNLEDDVIHREFAIAKPAHFDDGLKSDGRIGVEAA